MIPGERPSLWMHPAGLAAGYVAISKGRLIERHPFERVYSQFGVLIEDEQGYVLVYDPKGQGSGAKAAP